MTDPTPAEARAREIAREVVAKMKDADDAASSAALIRAGEWDHVGEVRLAYAGALAALTPSTDARSRGQAEEREADWTHGRAWPDMLEAVAQYWVEWEEDRAGRGTYTAEELAEDGGEFANGLADHLAALRSGETPVGEGRVGMTVECTSRGFPVARGIDRYSLPWSVQDSSLATEHCIWLGGDNRAHLTREAVAELIPLLQRFVDTGSIALPDAPAAEVSHG